MKVSLCWELFEIWEWGIGHGAWGVVENMSLKIPLPYILHHFQQPPWNKFPGSNAKSDKSD